MRSLAIIVLGLMLWGDGASAQTANRVSAESSTSANSATGVVGAPAVSPEFIPLTTSERLRLYVQSTFGPTALARAAASGGIAQWTGKPKEWGGGAEAYGERVGNSLAQHIIRKTLESGGAAVLREDNRYIRSTETGFLKRSKHAVFSTFVARNDAGHEHFAYSRFGGAVGASFISRIWQPPSANTSGDAAVNFGFNIATDMGWNVFREFWPNIKSHLKRHQ